MYSWIVWSLRISWTFDFSYAILARSERKLRDHTPGWKFLLPIDRGPGEFKVIIWPAFCSMSNFPPVSSAAPLSKQRAMAASRAAEFLRPEDSASNLGSTTSWTMMGDSSVPDASQPAQAPKAPPPSLAQCSQAQGWTAGQPTSCSSGTPPPPADFSAWSEAEPPRVEPCAPPAQPAYVDAPANQAARQVLGSAQQQAKKLAAQKAQAKRKGQKGIKWGQMSGANSQNFQLPHSSNSLVLKKTSDRSWWWTAVTSGSSRHSKAGC